MSRARAKVERTRRGSIGSRSLPLFFQTPTMWRTKRGRVMKNA